jgi:hypothetical protein
MRTTASISSILACTWLVASATLARAEVVGVDVTSRTEFANGEAFGDTGAYELVTGRIRFAVDPANMRDKVIVDLDKAPRNAAGQVEFAADLAILKPKDAAKANGTLLLDVVNRGNKTVLSGFNKAALDEVGDGFLMRRGFTIVWVGWEFDAPAREGAIRIEVPVAAGVHARVRASATPNAPTPTLRFATLAGYAPFDSGAANATLTVRDGPVGKPTPIAPDRFTLDGDSVTLQGGFAAGRTYELERDVASAPVAGLGFAAVRDTVAWLRHAADAPAKVQRTLGFGLSQSGRFLRTFLYLGFNADERNRQVFDGVIAHIAGASRLDLNRRGSTPVSLGMYDATAFPFADAALRDPVTRAEDGLLDNPRARDFKPKIFYTNTAVEYWGGARSAALIHTTPDGARDLVLPDDERVYFLTGSQHGPSQFPPLPAKRGAERENPNDYWLAMRALLVAMDAWLRDGTAPPPSRYPRLDNRTLVPAADVAFPSLPDVQAPNHLPPGVRAQNPLLVQDGAPGAPLPYLVPQTDRDGLELAGLRLPAIEVPLATYTGWNFRNPAIGGADQLFPLLGSYLPFPPTAAAREAAKDPRAAIAERYASKQAYLDKVRAAAEKLVAERYLLAEDVPFVLGRAGTHWDLLTH